MTNPRDRRSPFSDEDKTPPVRPPSVATLLAWSKDCDADALRCDALELQAAELASELRALAEMFRSWETAPQGQLPDITLRNSAYARLLDLRARMRNLAV